MFKYTLLNARPPTLCFYLQVYYDPHKADLCLSALRKNFPDSRVILLSDGDPNPIYQSLANQYKAQLIYGDRLYPIKNGGKMIHRMLTLFLHNPADYLIKLDTDTEILRPFQYIETRPCLFGSVQSSEGQISVQGGFVGMSHQVAERLADSQVFLRNSLSNANTWAKSQFIRQEVERTQLIRFEWLLAWGAQQLNIPLIPFYDVMALWKERPRVKANKFAAIHPSFQHATP